jgi:hypothetical protein
VHQPQLEMWLRGAPHELAVHADGATPLLVFSWVEGQKATLTTDALWKRGKLIMLRMCNELLRRLSKASATVLCGRILILLAHFFQLSERSALNLRCLTPPHATCCWRRLGGQAYGGCACWSNQSVLQHSGAVAPLSARFV